MSVAPRDLGSGCVVGVAMLLASCTDQGDDGAAAFECAEIEPLAGPAMTGPPALTAAAMTDRSTVRLVFTEAMAAVGEVDPSAFRLSLAAANIGDLPGTMYIDLASYADGSPCPPTEDGEECCYEICSGGASNVECEEKCVPGNRPLRVTAICNDGSDAAALQLHLSAPVDDFTCMSAASFEAYNEMYGMDYGGGIFVHYTDKKIPVTDATGDGLAPIGEQWALDADEVQSYADGSFPMLDPWLPIACSG